MVSSKNMLTPGPAAASLGLGLGDDLKAQMEKEVMERKRKVGQIAGQEQGQGIYNPQGLSQAAMSLGLSPTAGR